jgi:hypothetical protein
MEGGERKIRTFLRTRPIDDAHNGYDFPSETQVTVPVPNGGKDEVWCAACGSESNSNSGSDCVAGAC